MTSVNVPLEQNLNSKILNILKKVPYSSRYNNNIKENQPNNFSVVSKIRPNKRLPLVSELNSHTSIEFNLPRDQFLRNLTATSSLTSAGDNRGVQQRLGLFLWSDVYLMQFEKVIAYSSMSYILSRISDAPIAVQSNFEKNSNGDVDFNNNTVSVDTPFFLWPFEHEQDNLLLSMHRDLRLVLVWNNFPFPAALTNFDVYLNCYRRCYQPEYINSYIQENYVEQQRRNFFVFSPYKVFKIVQAGVNSTRLVITSPVLCFAIHLCLYDASFNLVNISNLKLYCGNDKIIDVNRATNSLNASGYSGDVCSSSDVISGQQGESQFSYYFGSKARLGFSAGLDLSVGPFEIIVDHDTTNAVCTLDVNLENSNIAWCRSDDGIFHMSLLH